MLALRLWHHYPGEANYINYPSTSLIILVNDMTSEKCKPYGKISKLAILSKYLLASFVSQ